MYVLFYSLTDSNKWATVGFFIEGGIDWTDYNNYDVALSGKTVIVGLPSNYQMLVSNTQQAIYVYRKNSLKLWENYQSCLLSP